MDRQFYVYILSNKYNKVLYIGITSDLVRRIYEHKQHYVKGFTARYNVTKLVYYEILDDPESAISREKQLKAGSRQRKLELINSINPAWKDLYSELCDCFVTSFLAMTGKRVVIASVAKQSRNEK